MTKKIDPKDQTSKLSEAKWEFLQRNPKLKKKYEDLQKTSEMQALRDRLKISRDEWDQLTKDTMAFPSVTDATADIFISWLKRWNLLDANVNYDELQELWKSWILEDAKDIMKGLFRFGNPDEKVLVCIDVTRPVDTIFAELEKIIKEKKDRLARGRPETQQRMKWLSIADELLQVWDLYEEAGQQPVKKTFKQISKKVDRPLSTVKSQWRKAYEMIFRELYSPDVKYATEDKKAVADALCAKCQHASCYKTGDWTPCQAYLRISGRERHLKLVEFDDNIRY